MMEGNGLPGAPLAAAQWNQPALSRDALSLLADGRQGRFFPAVAGTFIHFTTVDAPARVSFNNADFGQSLPLVSGLEVRGNFSGITLWHDDYTNWTAARPMVYFDIGRDRDMTVNNLAPSTQVSLPFSIGAQTTVLSSLSLPAPYGFKVLDWNLYQEVTAAALPLTATLLGEWLDESSTAIVPGSIVRPNGLGYASAPSTYRSIGQWSQTQAGAPNTYALAMSGSLPIPTRAERLRLQLAFPAVTANTVVHLTGYAR